MTFFYARWTGHGASTPSTTKAALFRITGAVAVSTSANLIAIFDALWAGHVASSPGAAERAISGITVGDNASTSAGNTVWQVSVLTTPSTNLLTVVSLAIEVASPRGAEKMAFFYARRTGHVASTPSTTKAALFRITGAVAVSTSANLIAIFDALWAGHVASSPGAAERAISGITVGDNASTSAGNTVWQVSVLTTPSTNLLTVVSLAIEVASPRGAEKMAFFYARWTGHVACTPSTSKAARFSFTVAVASTASANLIAISDALCARHVASTPSTVMCTVSSCITLASRKAASASYVACRRDRYPGKHK